MVIQSVLYVLYDLNRGFALTLECFERLDRLAFFRCDYLRAFHNMADELRARTNYELTETLRDHEQRESSQFGRLRVKWKMRFTSPGDAVLKPSPERSGALIEGMIFHRGAS